MIQSPTKKKRNTSELNREVTCFFCIIFVMAYEMFSSRNLWFKMFKIYWSKNTEESTDLAFESLCKQKFSRQLWRFLGSRESKGVACITELIEATVSQIAFQRKDRCRKYVGESARTLKAPHIYRPPWAQKGRVHKFKNKILVT